ncbi:MAG: hypothetical protein U0528_06710 [Anaerolineae bacterium]
MLGAFDGEVLVGIVGGYRDGYWNPHRAVIIVAMYVAEEAGGRGISAIFAGRRDRWP